MSPASAPSEPVSDTPASAQETVAAQNSRGPQPSPDGPGAFRVRRAARLPG